MVTSSRVVRVVMIGCSIAIEADEILGSTLETIAADDPISTPRRDTPGIRGLFMERISACSLQTAARGYGSSRLSNNFTARSAVLLPLAGLVPVTTRPEVIE